MCPRVHLFRSSIRTLRNDIAPQLTTVAHTRLNTAGDFESQHAPLRDVALNLKTVAHTGVAIAGDAVFEQLPSTTGRIESSVGTLQKGIYECAKYGRYAIGGPAGCDTGSSDSGLY